MSKSSIPNESIKQYLAQVCRHVKARDVHRDIKFEMRSHLDELVEDKVSEGLSEEEAVRAALAQMGDPDQIGKQLHAAHKPVMEWGLATLVAILVGIGLLAMYAMQFAYSDHNNFSGFHFFLKKTIYTAVGVLFVIGIYFLDYRKWQKYSWYLYSGTVALMISCIFIGIELNGMKSGIVLGGFYLDIYNLSPYLFMTALAGTLLVKQRKEQGLFNNALQLGKMVLFYAIVPIILYGQANAFLHFISYAFGLMILMLFVAKTYKLFFVCMGSLAAVGAVLITMNPYRYTYVWERYTSFLNSNASEDVNYTLLKSLELIRSAGMWGQGFGVEVTTIRYIYSDMVFTYLIYSLGWAFGIAIVILTLIVIGKVVSMARKLKDGYARGLVVGLFSIIGLHFVWNILMSVGLMPMNSTNMPFVSFGGFNGIIELMVMGIVLSVHRRKNMVSLVNREPIS